MFNTKSRAGQVNKPRLEVTNRELALEYDTALDDLTFNSKPMIDTLTLIAQENIASASDIVILIESRITNNPPQSKLPVVYLMDSVLKNVGGPYVNLFSQNLYNTFCSAFEGVDSSTKRSLQTVLKTWRDHRLFPPQLLDRIEAKTNVPLALPSPARAPPKARETMTASSANKLFINNPRKPAPKSAPPAGRPSAPAGRPSAPSGPLPIDRSVGMHTSMTQLPSAPLGGMPMGIPSFVPGIGLDVGLGSILPSVPSIGVTGFMDIPGMPVISAPDPNQQMLDDTEALILTQLFSVVYPNDLVPPALQLQELRPIILSQLQQNVQQGMTPPPNTAELLNQLQQLYQIKEVLSVPAVAASRSPVHDIYRGDSFETKIVEGFVPGPQGRGRGGRGGAGGRPAESPPRNEPTPILAAAQQGRLGLFPMYSPPQTETVAPPGASPPANITSILSDSKLRNLLKGLQAPPEPEIDITDVTFLSKHNSHVISSLYENFIDQCNQCGWRFKEQDKLSKHLDWHYRQNKREKEKSRRAMSRMWYLSKDQWTAEEVPGREFQMDVTPFEETTTAPESERELTLDESLKLKQLVIAREDQMNCPVCGEQFNQFWDKELEEWLCKEAVIGTDDVIYHALCLPQEMKEESNRTQEAGFYNNNDGMVKTEDEWPEESRTPENTEDPHGDHSHKRSLDEVGGQEEFVHQEKKPRTDTN